MAEYDEDNDSEDSPASPAFRPDDASRDSGSPLALNEAGAEPPDDMPTPGDGSQLSRPQLFLLAALILLLPLLGYVCNRSTAIPLAIASHLLSTGLLAVFQRLKVNRLKLNAALLGAVVIISGLLLLPGYRLWYGNFGQFRQGIENLSVKIESRAGEGKSAELALSERTRAALEKVDQEWLDVGLGTLSRTFLQAVLFSAAILMLPLFLVGVTPGLGTNVAGGQPLGFRAWAGPILLRTIYRLGQFSLVRITKALLIALLCAVGLACSGIGAFWFIAGIVFVFALVCNLSPLFAVLLGGMMVPTAANWTYAGIGVAVTTAVLVLAERKLHWYLFLVPMARRYNLPPEMLGTSGPQHSRILAFVPHLVSLAVFATLGWLVLEVLDIHKADYQRREEIRAANKLFNDNDFAGAITAYNSILQTWPEHPNDREIFYKLLRARLAEQDFARSLAIADKLRDWEPVEPAEALAKLRYRIRSVIDSETSSIDHTPQKPYEIMVKALVRLDNPDWMETLCRRIEEQTDKSAWAYLAGARAALCPQDSAKALEKARKAAELAPEQMDVLFAYADAEFAAGRYEDCVDTCDRLVEMDQNNLEARSLRSKANRALKGEFDSPAEAVPAVKPTPLETPPANNNPSTIVPEE